MKNATTCASMFLAVLLFAPLAAAQTEHSVIIYGIGASISGTVGVRDGLTSDVSIDTSEILSNLELAGMARYRADKGRWSSVFDGVFMGLGGRNEGTNLDIDLFIAEFDAGYRFTRNLEGFVGVRYTDLGVSGTTTLPGRQIEFDNGDEFVDPVVGLRFVTPLPGKWYLQGQGDLGGFGLDMDFQWQAMLDFGYKPDDAWSVWLGYRGIGQEFENSGNDGRFDMDVIYHGPQVAVAFHF